MKSKYPLVSVVIPCYNHDQFVQDSIQSVIDQDYENIELIIIDDGSQDNSVLKIQEKIEFCKKRFVRFEFRSRTNIGLSETLNEALEWCEGKYFSPIASDDQMLSNKTAIQVKYLEKNKEVVAAFGGVVLIDESNEQIDVKLGGGQFYSFEDIILHNYNLPAPTQMIRLNSMRKIGGYNPTLFIEDWYIWLKLSQIGSIYTLSNTLCLYRMHSNNSSNNIIKMNKARLDILSLFKDSILYEESLKRTKWLNSYEYFVMDRKVDSFLKLLKLNPKKTTLLIIDSFKRYITKNI